MTHPPSTLADRFAGLRQAAAAESGLDALILSLVLHLFAMLERMARSWEAGQPAEPRFRRHRRGPLPYRRRPRTTRPRAARTRPPHAWTPFRARPLPARQAWRSHAPRPPARASPHARANQA